jgi:hypothetical protein
LKEKESNSCFENIQRKALKSRKKKKGKKRTTSDKPDVLSPHASPKNKDYTERIKMLLMKPKLAIRTVWKHQCIFA